MRRIWAIALKIAAAAGSLAPAAAADLFPQEAPSAPPPTRGWTGFYVGGFAGGAFGGASQGYSVSSTFLSANLPSLLPFADNVGSQSLGLRGSDAGVEVGYDWKIGSRFVFGGVADANWSDLNGARVTSGTLPLVQFPYSISQNLSSEWRGSLRARAGVTPIDNLLLYATGGFAFGQFTYTASFEDQLTPPFAAGTETENAVFHAWRTGWTLGGGAEWALSRNWAVKGEYLFSQYSAVTGTGVLPLQQPPSTAYIAHSSGRIGVNSLRAGIDYRFD